MHQRSHYNLPTTEQPSNRWAVFTCGTVTAIGMQTAAMRICSQVKTGTSNNSKVMDSNPHSGPLLRLCANSADTTIILPVEQRMSDGKDGLARHLYGGM